MPGKMKSSASINTKLIMNGVTPLYTTHMDSFVMFLTIKTDIAMGGTIMPIMHVTDKTMINQMGSKPSFITAGKKMGVARIIKAASSIKDPPKR